MGICDNLVKTFLFLTNLLVFLLCCVVLGLGIWVLADKPSLLNLLDKVDVSIPTYGSAVILFLIVSIAGIIVSFLGCCGAYRESRCMLGTYFLAVLSLLILIAVGAGIGMTQGLDALGKPLLDTLALYDKQSSRTDIKEIVTLWDQVQTDLHCCGVHDGGDWATYNPRYGGSISQQGPAGGPILLGAKVPESCCAVAPDKALCQTKPTDKNGAYVEGCFDTIIADIKVHTNAIAGVAISIIVIMVLDLLIAFYMCACAVGSEDEPRPKKRFYSRPGPDHRV